jgi:nucleoside-diphosphate-sugar epimerase
VSSLTTTLAGKTVLVSGSAGFLGSRLCQRLLALGNDVVGIDNFSFSKARNGSLENGSNRITFRETDITRTEQVESVFKDFNFDYVFHLAAVADPRTCKANFDLAFNVNVVGTKNMLLSSKNCRSFIFMSSAAVYGEPLKLPMDECHPLNGSDPYAYTKKMGEILCLNFSQNYNRNVAIARNFNTFGIGQTGDYIIPTLIRQAITKKAIEIWNSSPIRDMTYVDDTIDAIIALASTGKSEIYNLGSGRGIQIGQLANTISHSIGEDIRVSDLQKPVLGSPMLVADNTKLRSLGWQESVGFEEGIRRTIEWFKTIL